MEIDPRRLVADQRWLCWDFGKWILLGFSFMFALPGLLLAILCGGFPTFFVVSRTVLSLQLVVGVVDFVFAHMRGVASGAPPGLRVDACVYLGLCGVCAALLGYALTL